ncbi:MAG: hypothetical protein WCY07_05740 [Pigmentiphaga sp.]
MRRWGSILILLGVNLAVGSLALAFYLASFGCAMGAADGTCKQGAVGLFLELMSSSGGIVFWVVAVAGALLAWKGWQLRRQEPG